MTTVAILIGCCLLIVPGIILAAGLLMTSFILKDDPQISALDAMMKSWKMTDGHKAELIYLFLSFLGWLILCALTLGIGLLLLYPYMQSALAHVYEDLKEEKPELSEI
jgi:Predicted integral membrane protein